jgi:uncharacterized protein with PIN domain
LREWEVAGMTAREEVHQLVQALRDAPTDDEPITPEEDAAAEDAWRDYQQGKALPWENVRKELPGD